MVKEARLAVVIVDDEPLARRRLRRILTKEVDFEVVGEAGDVGSGIDLVNAVSPDVVFLDVRMPGGDGFTILESIEEKRVPAIVFVTAFPEYALRAFDAGAVDYLLKPLNEGRLGETLRRLRERTGPTADAAERLLSGLTVFHRPVYLERIAIPIGRGRTLLQPVDVIDWFEADSKFVHVHSGKKKRTMRESIGRLEGLLDPARFLRVSRSAIVNIQKIDEIQSWFDGDFMLLLSSGAKVSSTRRYRKSMKALLGRHLSEE